MISHTGVAGDNYFFTHPVASTRNVTSAGRLIVANDRRIVDAETAQTSVCSLLVGPCLPILGEWKANSAWVTRHSYKGQIWLDQDQE